LMTTLEFCRLYAALLFSCRVDACATP